MPKSVAFSDVKRGLEGKRYEKNMLFTTTAPLEGGNSIAENEFSLSQKYLCGRIIDPASVQL